jgi:hypothetical protein
MYYRRNQSHDVCCDVALTDRATRAPTPFSNGAGERGAGDSLVCHALFVTAR